MENGGGTRFCGMGESKKTRDRAVVAQWGGRDVSGPTEELRGCFIKPCPVDCEVTERATGALRAGCTRTLHNPHPSI